MKKFIFLLVIVGFLSVQKAQAQIVMVADAVVQGMLEKTNGEQLFYYGEMAANQIANMQQFLYMVSNLEKQIQQNVQTLQSAKDITNFKDFMDWYNRSLYMERRTLDTLNNLDIKIGKKSDHFTDIENMAYGMKDTYIE
jgi:hypothetical protein